MNDVLMLCVCVGGVGWWTCFLVAVVCVNFFSSGREEVMTVEEAAGGRVISSLRVPRRGALGLGLNSGPARWAQHIPNIAHQLQHPRHQRCPAHFFVCGNKAVQNLLSAHTTGLFVRSFFLFVSSFATF